MSLQDDCGESVAIGAMPLKEVCIFATMQAVSLVTASSLPCPILLAQVATGEKSEQCIYSPSTGTAEL